MKHRYRTLALCLACALGGCTDPGASDGSSEEPAPTFSAVTDAWLGRWTGPEGTFLKLERAADGYEVTIANLDGPRVFRGVAADEHVEFERDGVKEIIRATDGAATGMKWLADKTKCLTIRYGEGYCRD